MKDITTYLLALLLFATFAFILHITPKAESFPFEPDTCEKITRGDFGERLCGYNIRMICFDSKSFGQRSYYEDKVCEKYFKLLNNSRSFPQ